MYFFCGEYLAITDRNSATIEWTVISTHQHLLRISTLAVKCSRSVFAVELL